MARIPDEVIERLKGDVALARRYEWCRQQPPWKVSVAPALGVVKALCPGARTRRQFGLFEEPADQRAGDRIKPGPCLFSRRAPYSVLRYSGDLVHRARPPHRRTRYGS